MPARIRSGYRRRILDWLTDGGGTVTAVAKAVGLRLPHASAELRKLRTEGWVNTDREAGSRGAVQRLTEKGWRIIRDDDISRLASIDLTSAPADALGCVLARDGPVLLLAYAEMPEQNLLALPDEPLSSQPEAKPDSIGNEGGRMRWTWAVRRECPPHWVDPVSSATISAPIEKSSAERIEDWAEIPPTWVIIRARLLESNVRLGLPTGAWFGKAPVGSWPQLPDNSIGGTWELGTAAPSTESVSPKSCVIASLQERLAQGLLMRSSGTGAWVLGDLDLIDRESQPWPLDSLSGWFDRAHPRLDSSEKEKRHNWLRGELSGRRHVVRRSGRQQATWKRFKAAWPKGNWRLKSPGEDAAWDLRGLDSGALASLVEWTLDNAPHQVVLQWPREIEPEPGLLEGLVSHPKMRLLLTSGQLPLGSNLVLRAATEGLPAARLHLGGDVVLPVHLKTGPPAPQNLPEVGIPTSPQEVDEVRRELLLSGANTPLQFTGNIPQDAADVLRLACLHHPVGDENFANACEGEHPLAAWIGSPSEERWTRWTRLSPRLPEGWLALLNPRDVPVEELANIAETDGDWGIPACQELVRRLHDEPDLLLDLHPVTKGDVNPWLAAATLSSAPLLPPTHMENITGWAWEVWSQNPTHLMDNVLPALEVLATRNMIPVDWSEQVRTDSVASGHPIAAWDSLKKILGGENLDVEKAVNVVEIIPSKWWDTISADIIRVLITESQGRRVLAGLDVAWTAAVLQPLDSAGSCPGTLSKHPGCPSDLEVLLTQHGSAIEELGGVGASHLLDLRDALHSLSAGKSPKPGRMHRLSGWLAQPLENWPVVDESVFGSGCDTVAVALYNRLSGYHQGLLKPKQKRLL